MPEIVLGKTEFRYEAAGVGEPLLLLHGGLGTALLHFWREIPLLAERFRVIAPDLRGYGRSSPPRLFPNDFYFRDADDMAALIEALGLGSVHVAGWSDGGIVGVILAVERPDLVRSLALWGAQARFTPEERAGWNTLADASAWTEGARRRFIEAQGPQNWPAILDRMVAGYNAFYNANAGDLVSRRLGEVRAPTLILHGSDDALVPVLHTHEMARGIPNARLKIYEGAGHTLHRERESELRADLLAFLAGGSDAGSG
jgi:pimeloyl-ACP methyl ester carboxylesterase